MATVVVMHCSNLVFMLIGRFEGEKNLRVANFLSKNLLKLRYRKKLFF